DTVIKLGDTQNGPLNLQALDLLRPQRKGWIMFQTLVMDSFSYELTSSSNFSAGFFAKLAAWLPGVSAKYRGCKTVVMSSTTPVTFGYHLWRPGSDLAGAAAQGLTAQQVTEKFAAKPADVNKELGKKSTEWVHQ